MRTQRTRSQRYIAAHAAVLVTRAEKLSRRYLRAGDRDSVLQYSRARSYVTGPVRTYARVPKRSGTEWNGTNGTERITSVFNWERYGIKRKLFFDSYCRLVVVDASVRAGLARQLRLRSSEVSSLYFFYSSLYP